MKNNIDDIRNGDESAFRVKYCDTTFFYKNDTTDKKLADFITILQCLAFQGKLRSMLSKKIQISSESPTKLHFFVRYIRSHFLTKAHGLIPADECVKF